MMLKAYKISCRDDDHGHVIQFAKLARFVNKRANSERCDCEYLDIRVHREPAADKFAPGPMTVADYLSIGWFWTCSGVACERQVYSDEPFILVGDDRVICSLECLERTHADCQQRWQGADWHESIIRFRDEVAAAFRHKAAELERVNDEAE